MIEKNNLISKLVEVQREYDFTWFKILSLIEKSKKRTDGLVKKDDKNRDTV